MEAALPTSPTPLQNLAVVLTHRLGNLLSATEGYAALLAESLAQAEDRHVAQRILEGTARMEHVLSDLRLFAHPVIPTIQTLSRAAITDILMVASSCATHERLFLDIVGQAPYPLAADPNLLKQGLLILLQNAFDATAQEGDVRLTLIFSPEAQEVAFQVWNTGAIDLPDLEAMFVPFFTTKVHNLGVGLPMARRIAEEHGGHLALIDHTVETGTCFTLTLPYPAVG